jgi:hypothetical protein
VLMLPKLSILHPSPRALTRDRASQPR